MLRFTTLAGVLAALASLPIAAVATPTVTVLNPNADNRVREQRFGNLSSGGTVTQTDSVFQTGTLNVGCGGGGTASTFVMDCFASYLRFDLGAALLAELAVSRIESATLRLRVASAPADGGELYTLAPVAAPWDPATLTWNNQPAANLSRRQDFTTPLSSTMDFDVKEIVEAWIAGSEANEGFVVFGASSSASLFGTVADYEARFHSREAFGEGDQPELVLEYNRLDSFVEIEPDSDNFVALILGGSVEQTPMASPGTNFVYGSGDLRVGCESDFAMGQGDTRCYWTLMKFVLPSGLQASDVEAATLTLGASALPTDLGDTFFVEAAGTSWNPATVNWPARPSVSGASAGGFSFVPPTSSPLVLDITTIVEEWAGGSVPNEGLILGNVVDAGPLFASRWDGDARFHSLESFGGDPANKPLLTIWLAPAPSAAAAGLVALLSLAWLARTAAKRRGGVPEARFGGPQEAGE